MKKNHLILVIGKEYEAKFLDINVNEKRELLKKLNGKIVYENKKYVRSVFDLYNSEKKDMLG